MPSSRAARSLRSASRSSTSRGRQRSASIHTSWGPLLNGNIMPWREEDKIDGKTLGLFFGRDDAIPEQKRFDSIISREDNSRFIEVQRAFKFDYYADFYQTKVIVGSRKYYVAGTFNRESGEVNTSLESYGYNKDFAGDVAIFFHSKYNPERFLDYLPRYIDANEREIAIRRVIAAFCKNVKDHVEKGTALRRVVRGPIVHPALDYLLPSGLTGYEARLHSNPPQNSRQIATLLGGLKSGFKFSLLRKEFQSGTSRGYKSTAGLDEEHNLWAIIISVQNMDLTCRLATVEGTERTEGLTLHAVIDTDVFTCLCRKPSNFPEIPPRHQPINLSPNGTTLPNFYKPRWIASSIPFLAFAPSSNPFKFHFLKCLDYAVDSVPIVKDRDGFYVLRSSEAADWDSLEKNMRAFLRACMRVNSLAIPEDFRLWPYPNNYGYRLRWRTEMDARHAAMRSRLAFIPLIACTSFFLHLLYHLESDWVDLVVSALEHNARLPSISPFLSKRQQEYEELRRGPFPTKWEWKEKLQQQTSISSEWLEYFHQILDLPMVGAFVDVHTSGCLPWIPVFLKAKIPLMLYWGSIDNWSIPTTLDRLICTPNSSIINTLISEQRPYPPPPLPTEGHIPREVPTNKPRLRLPRIDGGSLPRPNESLFDFIQRREVFRLKVITSESPAERQSRLQREENARKDRPPGRKGARVYYWDLVEGTRVRTAVGRSNYEDIWERYGSHQRRYDSVADEWEVCTDFDPNDAPDDYGPDSDDDSDCFITVRAHIDEETHHNDGAVSSQAYLARLQCSNKLTHSSIEFHEAIEDVAYHRFGFLKQPFAKNRDIVIKSQVWKKVLGLFGCGRRHAVLELDVHIKLQMCQFITRLLDAADLRHAPEVYDLSSSSVMQPPVPFEVDTLTSRNGCYFLIQAKDAKDDEEYVIAFRSAATIMEIARRGWGPRTEDIIKCLIEEGISFNTLMASHPPRRSLSMPFRRPAMLGFRPVGFVPTLQDYCSYELVRNDFLRSARGRSALLAGGIIARLARGIVDVNDVYDGPTGHALNEGEQALCVWEAGQACAFWDDKLTDEEMDLICGSYEVATGFFSREGQQQTAIKSWWPRSGSWRSCGLNCGYWSSDAEDWFRNRLDQILKSTVPMALMTSQEWHGRLKFQRAHTLSNKNDGFAAEYLKTKCNLLI